MNNLFFDIETIPSPEEHKEVHIEIIRKREEKRKKEGVEEKTDIEIHESTSLDGTFGRICAIGVIKEVDGKEVLNECYSGEEKEILEKFWEAAKGVNRFIGHNVYDFDFPFIYQRSIINGVRPRTDISFARYRDLPIFDTQKQWGLWSKRAVKLDTLAKVLGLPSSKDEMDGSMVWKYFQEGRIEEICRYCMKDVELTRQVYKKMVFDGDEDALRGVNENTKDDVNF